MLWLVSVGPKFTNQIKSDTSETAAEEPRYNVSNRCDIVTMSRWNHHLTESPKEISQPPTHIFAVNTGSFLSRIKMAAKVTNNRSTKRLLSTFTFFLKFLMNVNQYFLNVGSGPGSSFTCWSHELAQLGSSWRSGIALMLFVYLQHKPTIWLTTTRWKRLHSCCQWDTKEGR